VSWAMCMEDGCVCRRQLLNRVCGMCCVCGCVWHVLCVRLRGAVCIVYGVSKCVCVWGYGEGTVGRGMS
jgi:hypothetical protein